MNQAINDFIQGKRIAILGVSRSGKKFGNIAYKELTERGYQVSIVHPEAKEIEGTPCYPNLAALEGQIDGVLISLPPAKSADAVRDAAAAGIKNVWIMQGAESPEALAAAAELGLTPITKKCILMYAKPVKGMHGVHRTFARIFGQL